MTGVDVPSRGWLTAEEQRRWRAVLRGSALLTEQLERELHADAGLSLSEYEVMVRLSESPDRTLRMSALAQDLVHSRSRLTHTVSRMEARGLVSRCRADGDGRGVQCRLTEAGFAALQSAAPGHVDAVRQWLVDRLGADQFAVLGDAYEQVAAGIEQAGDESARREV